MREIKFRAWHIKNTRWINLSGLDIKFKGCLNEGSVYEVYEQGNIYFYKIEDVNLEQFTGLKDKNGVEIYEGDILKLEGIVSWNDVESRWSVIDLVWNNRREWHDIDYTTVPLEVIGNIHENKDLL